MARLDDIRAEIINDPSSIGYGPVSHADLEAPGWKSDADIATLMNTPGQSDPDQLILIPGATTAEVKSLIVHSEYAAVAATNKPWVEMLLSSENIIFSDAVKNGFLATFTNALAPTTRAAMIAAFQKVSSRAEELFGYGESVTALEVNQARHLNG